VSAATYFFVGGEREAFVKASLATVSWTTTSGCYDPNFSRGAVIISGSGSGSSQTYAAARLSSAQDDFWFTVRHRYDAGHYLVTAHTSSPWIELVDSDFVPIFRVMGVGGTYLLPLVRFEYWSGSAWIAAGDPEVAPIGAMHKFDFEVVLDNAAGAVRCYYDGHLLGEKTGDTIFTTAADVREVRFNIKSSAGSSNSACFSEVFCRDLSTLGRRLATLAITGAGAGNAWDLGGYADIDEVGTFSDADYMASETADQEASFVTGDLSATAATYAVEDVINAFRMQIGAVGPQTLKGLVRVGGTNYASPADVTPAPVTDMDYVWAVHPENPATTDPWQASEINTVGFETGLKSIA